MLLGPTNHPESGAGEAAGLARAPRAGLGDTFAASARTGSGLSGVLVVGPDGTRVGVLARLAQDALDTL